MRYALDIHERTDKYLNTIDLHTQKHAWGLIVCVSANQIRDKHTIVLRLSFCNNLTKRPQILAKEMVNERFHILL